jgi:hypothetical protein
MAFAPSPLRRRAKKPSGPRLVLDDLLTRIQSRLYPETIPVLASYWLKTVYSAGHNLAWWTQLHAALGQVMQEDQPSGGAAAQALADVDAYIRHEIIDKHAAPAARPAAAPPFRPELSPKQAVAYVCRLLNEWLPAEVAQLLTGELQEFPPEEGGMPPLAVGKAVERLLSREHFSPRGLELFLQPGMVCAYPAHAEILRDVVLSLLGRTAAPPPPLLPAVPLTVGGSLLPPGFADAVQKAALLSANHGSEELCVPLEQSQALSLLGRDQVHIDSILVTADGRWWESVRLLGGPECALVYRPAGRLRIDFTSDHARLTLPWPASLAYWPGEVHLPARFELFGRVWRAVAWERTTDRAFLRLEFTRALTLSDAGATDAGLRAPRLRPASAEMAWSELEQALATALSQRSVVPVDQLRREELIPLARAILRLAESLRHPAELEQSMLSVRYHHGAVAAAYGRIPSRVLPPQVLDAFRKMRDDARWKDLLPEIWEDIPGSLGPGQSSPPQAA